MDTLTINKILKTDPISNFYYKGCFAKDDLPKTRLNTKFPSAYVINTGLSTTMGEHWVAVFCIDRKVFYFDSLGRTPFSDPYISRFIQAFHPKNVIYNKCRIQGANTTVCGHYCVYFILHMCKNQNFKKFVIKFKCKNYSQNDAMVCSIITRRYSKKIGQESCFL